MSRKMIEVGVFFGMEWRSPSLIAFPRIQAYLRTAFYYFFHFYYFCHFIVLIQVLTRASNNDGDCTIENHARHTRSNTCALFQIVFKRSSSSIWYEMQRQQTEPFVIFISLSIFITNEYWSWLPCHWRRNC